jgi:hypothetical protein
MVKNKKFLSFLLLSASISFSLLGHAENSIIGTITDPKGSSSYFNGQITFTGLEGAHPTVVMPDGTDKKLTKLFESPDLITLQSVSLAGGTDTYYIEKKNKRFTLVSVGTMEVLIKKSVSVGLYHGQIR